MMGSGRIVCRMFMASESSSRTPFTIDCTQVASAFTLSWAEIRANSSFCFTGLLHNKTSHGQQSIVLQLTAKFWRLPWPVGLGTDQRSQHQQQNKLELGSTSAQLSLTDCLAVSRKGDSQLCC